MKKFIPQRKHSWYQPYSFVNHYYCRNCGIVKKSKNPPCHYKDWQIEIWKEEGYEVNPDQ